MAKIIKAVDMGTFTPAAASRFRRVKLDKNGRQVIDSVSITGAPLKGLDDSDVTEAMLGGKAIVTRTVSGLEKLNKNGSDRRITEEHNGAGAQRAWDAFSTDIEVELPDSAPVADLSPEEAEASNGRSRVTV